MLLDLRLLGYILSIIRLVLIDAGGVIIRAYSANFLYEEVPSPYIPVTGPSIRRVVIHEYLEYGRMGGVIGSQWT